MIKMRLPRPYGRADLHLVITRWGQPERVLAPGERAPWGKGIRVVAVTTRMIWPFGPWEIEFSGGREMVGGEVSLQIRDPLLLLGLVPSQNWGGLASVTPPIGMIEVLEGRLRRIMARVAKEKDRPDEEFIRAVEARASRQLGGKVEIFLE